MRSPSRLQLASAKLGRPGIVRQEEGTPRVLTAPASVGSLAVSKLAIDACESWTSTTVCVGGRAASAAEAAAARIAAARSTIRLRLILLPTFGSSDPIR